jgi:tripartite ATP-independent transporter DctM subunit
MIIILLVSFFILLILGVPMAFSVGVSALLAVLLKSSIPPVMIVQQMFTQLDSFTMMAIPLFILTGQLMNTGGITKRLINFSKIFVGRIPGGLSHVNVITSMFFAGVSGSATADTAGVGSILIPAMKEEGYEDDWAVGITAASSTIGPIIPPSVLMIVYGAITQLSVGRLFLAGLIPGILVGVSLLVVGYILALKRRKNHVDFHMTKPEIKVAVKESWPTLLAPIIIIVGITGGVFTPTEAGVIAALYSLILGIIYKELTWKSFVKTVWETAKSTTIVLFIIACASTFGWVLAHENIPNLIVDTITRISSNPDIIMLMIIALMLIIGLFIDGLAAILIFVPVLFPLANMVGFEPYHFATIIVVSIEIGGITPPVGLLLYIACGVNKIPIKKVSPLIWVFVAAITIVLLLVAFIPPLATFVPNTFMR